jgi:SAM-dependent methyltransferase
MPRTRSVDRADYLCTLAANRFVIHVGFAGESRDRVDRLVGRPTWLHGRLRDVASRLIGIDVDPTAVERARHAGFDAYAADASDEAALASLRLERAQLVIAGEVIEHVERPGVLLDALRSLVAPDGLLVVTTPNAASMLNPLAAAGRFELVNPDHVAFYSWFTLTNLLERHRWQPVEILTYHFPFAQEAWRGGGVAAAGRLLARMQSAAARIWPYLDFGLIAVCRSLQPAQQEHGTLGPDGLPSSLGLASET